MVNGRRGAEAHHIYNDFVVGLKPYDNPIKQRRGLFPKATARTFSAACKVAPFRNGHVSAHSEAAPLDEMETFRQGLNERLNATDPTAAYPRTLTDE
jgi:hypothetical protein